MTGTCDLSHNLWGLAPICPGMARFDARIPRLAWTEGAQEYVAATRKAAGTTPAAWKAYDALYKKAAIGNQHLGTGEARFVHGLLAQGHSIESVDAAVTRQAEAYAKTLEAAGLRIHFTHDGGPSLSSIIIARVRALVAQSAGERVDIDISMFNFRHKDIGDALLDLVAAHENVHVRVVTDWSQLNRGTQPNRLHYAGNGRKPAAVSDEKYEAWGERISIKVKADDPYVYTDRWRYSHSATEGLNHHKIMLVSIGGQPVEMIGVDSYNYSETAEKNYEDLLVWDRSNPINRRVLTTAKDEFVAQYNDEDTYGYARAAAYKKALLTRPDADAKPDLTEFEQIAPLEPYVPEVQAFPIDANDFSNHTYKKLSTIVGDKVAKSMVFHFGTYGRFSNFQDLESRVSGVRKLADPIKKMVKAALYFGSGQVPLNLASAQDLQRSLKLKPEQAEAIVAVRDERGWFETKDELFEIPGISKSVARRIVPRVSDDYAILLFSARGMNDARSSTGYAEANAKRTVPVTQADGSVAYEEADLPTAAWNLQRRAAWGATVKTALYGLSSIAEDFAAIVEGARTGNPQRVILNKKYNGKTAEALKKIAEEEGLDIEVRYTTKTMHQKFGVTGDDVYLGSANGSTSSTKKHSEDRAMIRNNQVLAERIHQRFDQLWDIGKAA